MCHLIVVGLIQNVFVAFVRRFVLRGHADLRLSLSKSSTIATPAVVTIH